MRKLFAIMAMLIVVTSMALAQDVVLEIPATTPEALTGSFTDFYVSLAALLPLITFIAAWINAKINSTKGIYKQIVSWLVAIALSYVGWFFKIGIFDNLTWWHTLIYGLGTGLAANGFFDIKMVQSILGMFNLGKLRR